MPEKDTAHSDDPLDQMLTRSDALMERLTELLDDAEFDGSPRGEAALGMCVVAMEHATALRPDGAGSADLGSEPDAPAV